MNTKDLTSVDDYYETLQVARSAAPEVVEAAYNGLSKKYGADPDPTVREKRRDLDLAYAVLSNPERRAQYDGSRGTKSAPPAVPASAQQPGEAQTTWPKGVVSCPRDPGVQTALRCSRCEKPICPKCLIQTPVGARCRDCAQIAKSPVYTVNTSTMVRAVAAAVIGGVVMGVAWGFLTRNVIGLGGFISLFVGAGLGYAFTRLMELATARKRGPFVVGCAMGGIVLAFGIQYVIVYQTLLIGSLIALGVAIYFAYQNLR